MDPLFTVHWLGTASGMPTRERNVSCLVLRVGKRLLLLDAGEGAQLSLIRSGFSLASVDAAFITHVHGDHVFGLPGFLGSVGLGGLPLPVVVGDRKVHGVLSDLSRRSTGVPDYPRVVLEGETEPREVFRFSPRPEIEVAVTAALLDHRVDAHGFRIDVQRRHPDRLDVEALVRDEIPRGPVWGQLQNGKDVTLSDGRLASASTYRRVGAVECRSFVYLTDTTFCDASVELARDADLVSHEATFLPAQQELARDRGHSTCADALRVFRESGARQLVLTHFSARNQPEAYEEWLKQEGLTGAVRLAYDGLAVDVPADAVDPALEQERQGG